MSIIGILFWIVFLVAAIGEIFGVEAITGVRVLFLFVALGLPGIGTFNGQLFVRK